MKLYGVTRIVTTAGSDQSAKALIKLGITSNAIIDYTIEDPKNVIVLANGGDRFDYAADLAGGPISEVAARVLKLNGNYLDVTFLSTPETRSALFDRACKIYNIAAYAHGLEGHLDWYGATLGQISDLIGMNSITPPDINITGALSEDTVREALQIFDDNLIFGKKLVMTI